ncbi:MAG: hypothetical protein AAGU75_23765 [Bacillota bacterium]
MSKFVVCKNTKKHAEVIQALTNRKIDFEIVDCTKKCFKCRTSVMIKQDDNYISASTVEKLLTKIINQQAG